MADTTTTTAQPVEASRAEFAQFFDELDKEIATLEATTPVVETSPPQSPPQTSPRDDSDSSSPPSTSPGSQSPTLKAASPKPKLARPVSQKLYGVFKHKAHIGFDVSGGLVFNNLPEEFEKKAAELLDRVNVLERKAIIPETVSFRKKTSVTSEVVQEMQRSKNPSQYNNDKSWLNPSASDEERMRLQRLVNVNKAMMDFELEETMASMDAMVTRKK